MIKHFFFQSKSFNYLLRNKCKFTFITKFKNSTSDYLKPRYYPRYYYLCIRSGRPTEAFTLLSHVKFPQFLLQMSIHNLSTRQVGTYYFQNQLVECQEEFLFPGALMKSFSLLITTSPMLFQVLRTPGIQKLVLGAPLTSDSVRFGLKYTKFSKWDVHMHDFFFFFGIQTYTWFSMSSEV